LGEYSIKLDPCLWVHYKDVLSSGEKGELSSPQYTYFSFKNKDWKFTFYKSGKILVQGKTPEYIMNKYFNSSCESSAPPGADIIKPMTIAGESAFSACAAELPGELAPYPHTGSDESGKGDFFGPLCIAGCYLTEEAAKELKAMGVTDSKKLDDKKILKLEEEIRKMANISYIVIRNQRYNELYAKYKNLNRLLAMGHTTVLEDLINKTNTKNAVIDKFANEKVIISSLKEKGKKINIIQMTKAECDTAVAAASIVARAAYVKKMDEMNVKYNFEFPKGAGDNVLIAGKKFVQKFGKNELINVSKIHFRTYKIL